MIIFGCDRHYITELQLTIIAIKKEEANIHIWGAGISDFFLSFLFKKKILWLVVSVVAVYIPVVQLIN